MKKIFFICLVVVASAMLYTNTVYATTVGSGSCTPRDHNLSNYDPFYPNDWWCDSWSFSGAAAGGPSCSIGYVGGQTYFYKTGGLIGFSCYANDNNCAASTCIGSSCWNSYQWVSGTKTCNVDNGCAANTCSTSSCWNSYQWVSGTKTCNVDNGCAANTCVGSTCWNSYQWRSGTKTCNVDNGCAASTCSYNTCYNSYQWVQGTNINACPVPSLSSASCPSPGTTASLSWSNTGAPRYYLVTRNVTDGSGDSPQWVYTNSGSISTTPGKTYWFWAHSCTSGGTCNWNSSSPQYKSFTCTAPAVPTITFTASPSVAYNGRATLTWSSQNATSCVSTGPWSALPISGGSGLTDPLTSNTTFTFRCTGPGGTTATISRTVTVGIIPAPNSLSATCSVSSASLSWQNTGASLYYLVTRNVTDGGADVAKWVYTNYSSVPTVPGKTYQFWVHSCTAQDVCNWVEHSPVTTLTCQNAPTGLTASCPLPGNNAILSWNASNGASYYAVRIDDTTKGINDDTCSGATGDSCPWPTTNSYSFIPIPGDSYRFWVHACSAINVCNWEDSSPQEVVFTCVAPMTQASLEIDLNNNGSYDVTLPSVSVKALGAGGAETVNWTGANAWTAVAGTHKFRICADALNSSSESNESNNCSTGIFTVEESEIEMTGSLSIPSCTISNGGSTCTTLASWSTENPEATSAITKDGVNGNYKTGNNKTDEPFTLPYGSSTFRLYNHSKLLDTVVVTAGCSTSPVYTVWNTDNERCETILATLSASLEASPSSGVVPLSSTLTATRTGGTASGAISYRFKCKTSNSWSSSQSSNSYSCNYPLANTYTASAEVTQQGVTAIPTTTITVNPPAVDGSCLSPAIHYNCPAGSTSLEELSSPSRWTWRCTGLNGGDPSPQCFERKSPGFIEN
ncbi:hypothetical protein KKG24_01255 [Patescibacteria group bacterium]|nr:hypothetical protein [Patescibacteria group bacterium]